MASSKEYLTFILEQLSDLEGISYRAMMGEYIIYYREKIVGGIYDDRLLVKPVKSAVSLMPNAIYELPYDGAKEMLLVNNVDNKDFLTRLFVAMYDELPAQKEEVIKSEFDEEGDCMKFPLTLYYDTEMIDIEVKDSSRGDSDFRKAYIVNDGESKIVIKYFSNSFSNQNRILGWFQLMEEYRKIGLYCPNIIPNRYGERLYKHTIDGRDYYIYAEEFAAFNTAAQLDVEKKQYMPDVLRDLGTIASKRLDFLDFPSAYCLLEPFTNVDTTDDVTECALLFTEYIKNNLPQHLPRAKKILDLFYKNQKECRKFYHSLPTSCFQADLNSSNILLDNNLKFVGLFDFNLCGKEKIINYAMREALWATYQSCLVDKDNNYIFYFDKKLDDIRMNSFLENMSYIQETYSFNDEEKKAFPILLRYINTFWWYSLSELEAFSNDNSKIEKMLDWFEYQMTRDDLRLK